MQSFGQSNGSNSFQLKIHNTC